MPMRVDARDKITAASAAIKHHGPNLPRDADADAISRPNTISMII